MATASTTPIRPRREMQEVKAPEQFQFSDTHRTLEGVYLGDQAVQVKGKDTIQFMIEDERKQRYTFLATYDLQQKIRPEHIGHWMTIIYEGEDGSIKTQGSPMKRFKVGVSKEKESGF